MALFPSLNGATPMDGIVTCLGNFLQNAVMKLNDGRADNLEIEAKFGALIDRGTEERIFLPVLSECGIYCFGWLFFKISFLVINYEGWSNFVSDMPMSFHKRFNELLNSRVSDRASVLGKEILPLLTILGMEVSTHSYN